MKFGNMIWGLYSLAAVSGMLIAGIMSLSIESIIPSYLGCSFILIILISDCNLLNMVLESMEKSE